MALLNMANIEREHRSIEKAIGHYKHIIKLSEKQNAGGSNDMQEQTHDAWEATWIIGPHQKCVYSRLIICQLCVFTKLENTLKRENTWHLQR